ncbi:hypothetical protein SLS60_009830 [Paraconiothyrium brasiliense]|uniref:tyrosinase n=1 Tax=Paraconiothyrium brasiliense TaxID=300254 RepID=A0ABR3QSL1_9PLEO
MANFRLPLGPLLLSLTYLFASSIFASTDSIPREHTVENISNFAKRQDGIFSVLGIAGLGDRTVYPRLEIRDLEKNNPDQWNVFLLGLQRFQSIDQSDKLSYFQIAGIHGRPFVPWDGVNGDDYYWSRYSGYCTHDSNIFPTWHRPFLALFEEILFLNAREAVSALSNGALKNRYAKALPSLRLPYWDWAAIPPGEEGTLPASVQAQTVNVTMPNGTVTITNPLHSYKFHPLPDWEAEGDERWKEFPETVRAPTTADKNAHSNNTKAAQSLQENRSSMQARVYNLLAMQHEYLNMSTKLIPGDSMETLKPFHKDDSGNFWTSDDVRDHTIFGYTYPDLIDISNTTTTKLNSRGVSTSLIARVNALYGPNASPLQSPQNQVIAQLKRGVATTGAPHFSGKRQYTLNIEVHEFNNPGSLAIYAFFGPPTGGVGDWVNSAGFVGTTSIFGASAPAAELSHSIIPLTPALEAKAKSGELLSMDEGDVSNYLKSNLRWRVVKQNADLTNWTDGAPGLEVSVTWQEIEPAVSEEDFPSAAGEEKELLCADASKQGHFK